MHDLGEERVECQVGFGHRLKLVHWNSDRLEHRGRHLCSGSAGVDGAEAVVAAEAEAVIVVLEWAGEEEVVEVRPESGGLVQLSRHVSGVVEGCGGCSTSVA